MEKKDRTYQVIRFDRGTNDFDNIRETNNWVDAVETAIEWINVDVDRWNEAIVKCGNARKIDYVEYDEMYEAFDNGQNWCINNHVYSIIDITIEDKKPEYDDIVLLIWGVEMTDMDIKAIKIPFDDKKFFDEYMKRVVTIMGGKYECYSLDEFDEIINSDKLDIGEENRPYVIHTKIAQN